MNTSNSALRGRLALLAALAAAFAGSAIGAPARAADWITAPSYYTHDPQTNDRVNQYAQRPPLYVFPRADYRESSYQHYYSSIQVGGSSDNYHVVREYGRPVRPYGEWERPFRPYSVPYDQWGPPYGGLGGQRLWWINPPPHWRGAVVPPPQFAPNGYITP